jgi:hypothetical protein
MACHRAPSMEHRCAHRFELIPAGQPSVRVYGQTQQMVQSLFVGSAPPLGSSLRYTEAAVGEATVREAIAGRLDELSRRGLMGMHASLAPSDRFYICLHLISLRNLKLETTPGEEHHRAVLPPSTRYDAPVMNDALSDARNMMVWAISSGLPTRLSGTVTSKLAFLSAVRQRDRCLSMRL